MTCSWKSHYSDDFFLKKSSSSWLFREKVVILWIFREKVVIRGFQVGQSWSLGGHLGSPGGAKLPRASPPAFGNRFYQVGVGARCHQGGTRVAPGMHRGGKGALPGPAYEVLGTTKRSSEDLTRRWARGPANFCLVAVSSFGVSVFCLWLPNFHP